MTGFEIPTPDLVLGGLISAVTEFVKPIVPVAARKYLPYGMVVIGGVIGSFSPLGWVCGAISGFAAAGVYMGAKNMLKSSNGDK